MAEEHLHPARTGEFEVVGHRFALVPGQRASQRRRQLGERVDQRVRSACADRSPPRWMSTSLRLVRSTITAAALIMIAVFGGFMLGDLRAIKLFGISLASAVFLDAGNANWYLPTWLDQITPHVSVERPDDIDAAAPPKLDKVLARTLDSSTQARPRAVSRAHRLRT